MGKVAFVQGASRGLGLALAGELAAREDVDRVYASSRQAEASEGLRALRERHGPKVCILLEVDVRSELTIGWAAEKVASEQKAVHLLICAAGMLHESTTQPEKRFEQVNQVALEHSFAVNAQGPILTARHLLPLMMHGERAVIANISAHAGSLEDNHLGGWYSYRASKAAQNMLTRTLAIELRRRAPAIICVALDPGSMDTELSRPFRRNIHAEDLVSPAQAATRLLALIDGLGPEQSGQFFRWDGRVLPW
jgi:NAD(P)-dependent dehydrogenase (short-subunit alcohol dehydrogenase family)